MPDAFTDRVEEIVCTALEAGTSLKRERILDANCGSDSRLRAAVEAMLAVQPEVDSFFRESRPILTSSLPPDPGAALETGERVPDDADVLCGTGEISLGPYRLLQKIGEGGCGSVYLAEQQSPIRRRVALKIIKLGMDTRRVIARFETERQALALVNHPNIARALDAGATNTGRPYFVMELVQGTRITTYCDEHCLDLRQRLELFIQVCNAIQHAHQNGIIHRDIKPSNILVTHHDGLPVSKVIDFGIAKATTGPLLTDRTLLTACDALVGTPAYMSPEQADMSGLNVDTRSDIYSLGVLLYELLTGRTPFDQQELIGSGWDNLRRTLRECEPRRPSVRLSGLREAELNEIARRRCMEARKLRSLLEGDLDWVVMKALEKDRSQRYETANALAMEVQRYLKNEPVLARPPTRRYRLSKLVRRNKAVFAGIGAFSLMLIGGLGVSSWLFLKEREARLQQVMLRKEADIARAEEKRLRLEAEETARIARAAILVTIGQLERADALIDPFQIELAHPSLEAARVFSCLGDWNALQGQWERAAQCFLKLHLANQIDKSDLSDNATRDLLRIAPTLLLAGDEAGYRRIIRESIVRFAKTTNPIAAEQVLKISTIVPVENDVLTALKPLVRVAENSLDERRRDGHLPACVTFLDAWRALALSMYHHRNADFHSAVSWGRRALECEDRTPTRLAMTYSVLAMALNRIKPESGFSELAAARAILVPESHGGRIQPTEAGDDDSGYWNDWMVAQLLFDEASQFLGHCGFAQE